MNHGQLNGGAGGKGSVTLTNLTPELNYEEKEIVLDLGEIYQIDRSKINFVSQLALQDSISLGNLTFEILDTNIANLSGDTITGVLEGNTKLKITDVDNQIVTYVYITVIQGEKSALTTGNNFTVALKQNGTVWSFGKNDLGQLGSGDNLNKNEPISVKCQNSTDELKDIKQISSGYSHSVALSNDGKVYTWGANNHGQLGNGTNNNTTFAVEVQGLKDIEKVEAYQNITIALDKDGNIWVCGEGYSILPMKLISPNKMIDVSGKLFLSKEGYIYDISDLGNRLNSLSRISKISSGKEHYLALETNGNVYSWGGKNKYGELGKTSSSLTAVVTNNAYNISAGDEISFISKDDGESYSFGLNTSGQLGLGNTEYSRLLAKVDIGKPAKVISHGCGTHSAVADANGFVYMTGTNVAGELGNGNNTNSSNYIKIGDTIVETDKDTYYLDINETTEVVATLENTFNLKNDIVDDSKQNFTISIPDSTKLSLSEYNKVTAIDYGTNECIVTHNGTGKTKIIVMKTVKKMNDIIQGIRDCTLTDGIYEIAIQDEIYKIELYNYYSDMKYSLDSGEETKTIELGNDTADETMLVVKYHGNLEIDKYVTLTAKTRKKGMYVCVLGNIINNGEITMTARRSKCRRRTRCILMGKHR